jgi:hypothetical protein
VRTSDVGKDSRNLPPIPDLAIVARVVRLAEECEAERLAHRPTEHPEYGVDDSDDLFRHRPKRDALVDYLRRLPEETVAGLYAIYRVGELPRCDAGQAAARYQNSYAIAIQPMHNKYGADDLAAKGSLADGLRHGLRNPGLELGVVVAHTTVDDMSKAPERKPR